MDQRDLFALSRILAVPDQVTRRYTRVTDGNLTLGRLVAAAAGMDAGTTKEL